MWHHHRYRLGTSLKSLRFLIIYIFGRPSKYLYSSFAGHFLLPILLQSMFIRPSPFPPMAKHPASETPGLHIVANLASSLHERLTRSAEFKTFIDSIIAQHNLRNLGEVFYDFPTGGFTAVVCLAESHLSIHTWPEKGFLTFDVFLSNYQNDNRGITQQIYGAVCDFFQADIIDEHFLNR